MEMLHVPSGGPRRPGGGAEAFRGRVRLADASQAGCGFQGAFPGRRADGRQPRANWWKAALNAFDITQWRPQRRQE